MPERLLEYARAELAPREVLLDEGQPIVQGWVGQVRLCHGSPNAALIALSSGGHSVAERVVELSDVVGDMRARTLAVALAELFASTSPNARAAAVPAEPSAQPLPPAIASAPASAPSPLGPVMRPFEPAPPLPPIAQPAMARSAFGFGGMFRLYFRPQTALLGPYLSVESHRWLGELSLLTANRSAASGAVILYNANLAAAYALLETSSPSLALRARGELGMVWATGNANRAGVLESHGSELQAALAIEFGSAIQLYRWVGLDVRAAAGVARGMTATADGHAVASTGGAFVGFAAGMSFDWARGPGAP